MALGARGGQLRLPLLTAAMIATTRWSMRRVRASPAARSATRCGCSCCRASAAAVGVVYARRRGTGHARQHWPLGLAGGVGTTASYAMALWAMTQAPVAMISALRESSILFALLISVFLLRERCRARAGSVAHRGRRAGVAAGVSDASVVPAAGRQPVCVTAAAFPADRRRPARSPSRPHPRGPVQPGSSAGGGRSR